MRSFALRRTFAWSGLAWALTSLGGMLLARFLPPPSPAGSAAKIARLYTDHATAIRIGMTLAFIGTVCLLSFGTLIVEQLRRAEYPDSLVSRFAFGALVATFALGELIWLIWALAAFRPAGIDANTTRMLNDLGWFLFLYAVPPVDVFILAIGWVTLRDPREHPLFPRWFGYLNIWCAFLLIPGMAMLFFKTGPLDWRGLITLYIVLLAFGVWLLGTIRALLLAIAAQEAEAQTVEGDGTHEANDRARPTAMHA